MNLLLITEQFPYGQGEQFIGPELQVLATYFKNITVVPLIYPLSPTPNCVLAANVHVRTDITAELEKMRAKRASMEMMDILAELPLNVRMYTVTDLPFCHPFTARDVIDHFAADSVALAGCIGSMVAPEDRTIVYSYWLMRGALAASLLKEQGKCMHAIARAHRYDVFPEASNAQRLPLRKPIFQYLDAVYPCCHAAKNELLNTTSALHEAINTRYLGVESQSVQAPHSTDGVLRIVSCSSLKEHKRVGFIADALSTLQRPAEWLHIGGSGEALHALEARMEVLPSHIHASALGEVPHAAVHKYYRTHPVDVCVNVSTSEGLPVSLMEAMSYGIPCIAMNVGGVAEMITPRNGVVLQSDSTPADLAAILESWNIEDVALRTQARLTQQTTFDASKNYAAFAEEILQALLVPA